MFKYKGKIGTWLNIIEIMNFRKDIFNFHIVSKLMIHSGGSTFNCKFGSKITGKDDKIQYSMRTPPMSVVDGLSER